MKIHDIAQNSIYFILFWKSPVEFNKYCHLSIGFLNHFSLR